MVRDEDQVLVLSRKPGSVRNSMYVVRGLWFEIEGPESEVFEF